MAPSDPTISPRCTAVARSRDTQRPTRTEERDKPMVIHVNRERCDECGSPLQPNHVTQCAMCASYVCGRCDDGEVCVQCRTQQRRERLLGCSSTAERVRGTQDEVRWA
jgi:hypothetical protein